MADKKEQKNESAKESNLSSMENNDINVNLVKYALSTEKSIRLMELQNKLVFVVERKSKKVEIKKAIESLFNVKITKVATHIDRQGNKRAYVTFAQETPAIDVATKLGIM